MGIRSTWTGCSLNQTPNQTPDVDDSSLSVAVVDGLAASVELAGSAGKVVDGINLTCRGERRYDSPRKVTRSPSLLPLCIGCSDVTVIYGHDTTSTLYDMMSYFAKFTGENLPRYLSKIDSVGLRKS